MNRRCDKIIVLGRLCGDALFLFAERSMPVPYIGDPDIKISDPHPGPTTRVLLDYRQVPCTTVCPPGLPAKNAGPPPQPDPTCFTRLPTTATLRQFARRGSRQKISDPHPGPTTRVLLDFRLPPPYDSLGLGPAQENDPWRFRQQSSRVISIQFWYLTSWLPRFL